MEPNVIINEILQNPLHEMYQSYLSKKIKIVCSKIKFEKNDIKWIIYDPKITSAKKSRLFLFTSYDPKSLTANPIEKSLIGTRGKDYGFCDPGNKEIYISILAIQGDLNGKNILKQINNNLNLIGKTYKLSGVTKNKRDFLADVILDEITHIVTKSNHGDDEYDETLERFRYIYYSKL